MPEQRDHDERGADWATGDGEDVPVAPQPDEPSATPDGPDPASESAPEDIVEAARQLDPGADALPPGADPLAAAEATPSIHASPDGGIHSPAPTDAPLADEDDRQGPGGFEPAPERPDQDVLRPGGGPPVRRPARVIALANQKGGVGKTTSVINLGAALAELDNRVLLVDMDPQGSLGVGIGAEPHTLSLTVYNLLMNDGTSADEVILQTAFENLHILPSNIDLAAAEIMLVQEVAREQSLRRVLDRLRYRYDFILVDCPPSLGLLTINGLTAADGVIVPLECEYFALRGMTLLMNTIRKVQERLNPELEVKGILATMVDTRTIHAREVLERVHEAFGSVVFKSTINKTIRFAEAPVAGEPILTYAAENRGADAYRQLAREVLSRESTS